MIGSINSDLALTGEATIKIKLAKAANATIITGFNNYKIYEFGSGSGEKEITNTSDNGTTITFTDTDISTKQFYRVGFANSGGYLIDGSGTTAWNEGIIPVSMTITQGDKVVNITISQQNLN